MSVNFHQSKSTRQIYIISLTYIYRETTFYEKYKCLMRAIPSLEADLVSRGPVKGPLELGSLVSVYNNKWPSLIIF